MLPDTYKIVKVQFSLTWQYLCPSLHFHHNPSNYITTQGLMHKEALNLYQMNLLNINKNVKPANSCTNNEFVRDFFSFSLALEFL